MMVKVISVRKHNKYTGQFTLSLDVVKEILDGKINRIIVVDQEDYEDPFDMGQHIYGPELFDIVGEAVSNGPIKGSNNTKFFFAKRPM